MRGLAFPTDPQADRETSNECGSPSNATDDIPIDPALNAIPLDPSLVEKAKKEQGEEEAVPPHEDTQEEPTPRKHTYYAYSQVPEGDPALFQQQELFPPAPHPEEPPPMTRRVRGPKRRKRCSFCRGDDHKNKYGVPESMVGCSECGRVGHPSCLQLADVAEILHSYAWVCIECKKCEFCHEKGADDRLMFCDRCDRGYHMDCFDPPIAEMPTGKWYCPGCERDYPQECVHPEQEMTQSVEQPEQPSVQDLFSSPAQSTSELPVASTSQLPPPTPAKRSHKRKHRAVVSSDEEEVDVESLTLPKRKSRLSAKMAASVASTTEQRGKLKASASQISITDDSRSHKRRRVAAPSSPQPLRIRLPPQRNKGKERAHFQDDDIDVEGEEDEEEQKGMFDDILTPEERDTSKTEITPEDTRRFEAARTRAEARLASSATAQPPEWDTGQSHQQQQQPEAGPSGLRPRIHPRLTQTQPVASSPAPVEAQPPGVGQRIQCIRFGPYDIKTWYDAPFPEEYSNIPDGRLWLCEFCLKYMKSRLTAGRHKLKCKMRHPPGDEIYRDGAVSIFEVDGRRNKIYCQNLCLLSKMFLDHKSLFYDVEPFLFYVMTEVDEVGARFVGYFSKEKRSHKDYNLSCIMTLPVRQRQGFGNLLIDFSYLLSKREQRLGSPEKPLSGLGALGYRNYWKLAVHRYLATAPDNPRLEDISAATSMTIEDVYNTLKLLDFIDVRPSTPPSIRPSPGQAIKFPKAIQRHHHRHCPPTSRSYHRSTTIFTGTSSKWRNISRSGKPRATSRSSRRS
ncbi:uncharacterized protein SCHCODRAFT_02301541 [Schizophyllum commune H4-8]|uniref:uncharacterized protein n=1 Tax=Schizophyllum commune (strain H4-8 / FGSC 9210) TaxID=578458 RepID=UPI0021604DD3|nr:uncharacterized protein SCHCODRAFT_02301541 [Schizophyllum commune H4-8]KAI5892790.1 hypothetical protein SCHCODRAFT_02301541 [Schizophyllum commune H4-8]